MFPLKVLEILLHLYCHLISLFINTTTHCRKVLTAKLTNNKYYKTLISHIVTLPPIYLCILINKTDWPTKINIIHILTSLKFDKKYHINRWNFFKYQVQSQVLTIYLNLICKACNLVAAGKFARLYMANRDLSSEV